MQIAVSIIILLLGLFLLIFPQVLRRNHINSLIAGLKNFGLYGSSADYEKSYTGGWFYRFAGLLVFAFGAYFIYEMILKNF